MQEISGLNTKAFFDFAINFENTQAILDVQREMIKAPNRNEMIRWTQKSLEDCTDFKKLYEERYIPEYPNRSLFMEFAEGTYGRALGEHLVKNNIELDFKGLDVSMFYSQEFTLMGYLGIRGIRIHDLIHALLGLGVSPVEEVAFAAFTSAQYRSPYNMVLMAAGLLNTAFFASENIPKLLDMMNLYYTLGMKAKFVTGYRFEDNYATPLKEVRRVLNLPENLSSS